MRRLDNVIADVSYMPLGFFLKLAPLHFASRSATARVRIVLESDLAAACLKFSIFDTVRIHMYLDRNHSINKIIEFGQEN